MSRVESLNKVLILKAAEICRDIELGPEAGQLLQAGPDAAPYLNALLEQKLYIDAIRFMARALPKREATWWACLSARSTLTDSSAPPLKNALLAAEAWVFKPDEANRRQAEAAAQAANFENAVAWAAMAAFWSGDNIAPEHVQAVVPPADHLNAKAVAGAVMLAAVQPQPELAETKQIFFLEQAVDIANGGNGKPWQA